MDESSIPFIQIYIPSSCYWYYLRVTSQLIKITRLVIIDSYNDIFNYFHKVATSVMGSVLIALALSVSSYFSNFICWDIQSQY